MAMAAMAAMVTMFALVSVGLSPVQAQQEPAAEAPPEAQFADLIHVKVVNVLVYVRDKKTGEPVSGLAKDEFVLLENKRPVTITNFYEVAEGSRTDAVEVADPLEGQLERLRSHPELDPRRSAVPENERLWLVVYVDHFNIRPHNRNRVFRHVRQFLRQNLDQEDRVSLVSSNRSLKVERGFTRDPQVISTALFELEKHTGGRTNLDGERKDLLREIKDARDPGQVEGRIRLFAENLYNDFQFTMDSMRELVDNLAGVPGRKAVLYVSDGLPMRPGEDLFVALSEAYPNDFGSIRLDAMRYDTSRELAELANAANANEIALYTLDATGLLGRDSRGADVQDPQVFSTNVDSIFQRNMQDSIMFLADETGGQYIVNTNNFSDGFERFGADFDYYYSLGFSPGHAGSGRRYALRCEVPGRKDLEVRCRESYRDKSIELEMQESTLASLQFGVQRNDLGVSLHPKESILREDGNYTVHVDLRIPIGELVLLPRPQSHEAQVRIWVQARDEKGNLSDPSTQLQAISVALDDLETAREKYFTYQLPLVMRPGDHRLSVGVRDDYGARSSLISQALRVGS